MQIDRTQHADRISEIHQRLRHSPVFSSVRAVRITDHFLGHGISDKCPEHTRLQFHHLHLLQRVLPGEIKPAPAPAPYVIRRCSHMPGNALVIAVDHCCRQQAIEIGVIDRNHISSFCNTSRFDNASPWSGTDKPHPGFFHLKSHSRRRRPCSPFVIAVDIL